jgi:broad specificity phosphatase PhoE
MRHGQSKANLKEIIISHPENGLLEKYGLTELGRQQARQSAASSPLTKDTLILSSDFSRARQTAEIVREVLGSDVVQLSLSLRERNFGNYEESNHSHYGDVWVGDTRNADHAQNGVESVNSVLSRSTQLILDIEQRHTDRVILLVSHGDCLQILETGFEKISATEHRSLPHLHTAEIRQIILK